MEWTRGHTIGHGSFGTVNLAIPQNQSFPLMAVKSCGASNSSSLTKEKLVLDELTDCPQIIRCFGDNFSFENGEKIYNVLLEYATGGALADKIKNSGVLGLPEIDVRRYTNSILKGLRFIHKTGFVHCDIKPQNVLLLNDTIKIADFGLAKKFGVKGKGFELRGTPLYMSPEIVSGGDQESPADIWALGCLVSEMVTGAPAWGSRKDLNVGGLLMKIGAGEELPEIPGKLCDEGKDFLGKCFVKDPRERWTAEMLLQHPFVSNYDDVLVKECNEVPSTSPRSAFDFPDLVSGQSSMTCSITSLSLPGYAPADRLGLLVTDEEPDWSVWNSWVTVR